MTSNVTPQMSPSRQQRLVNPALQSYDEARLLRDSTPQSQFRGTGLQHSGSGHLNVGRDLNIITRVSPRQSQVYRAIHFPRNNDFVQRSALSEQLAKLLPTRPDYQSAALWGLGGSGKTQLALDYVYHRCGDPTCSVFWVHADNETSFTRDYKWIATKLGIGDDVDGEKLLMAVRAHIETLPQWVLVLDNADDLSLFGVGRGQGSTKKNAPNLSTYIPRGTVGAVLWTSRDQRIVGSIVEARRGINVVRMTGAESKALFQAVSILDIAAGREQDDLTRLLAEVEWLPLAITQTAAYIRRTRTSIAEYLEKIQQRKKRWKVLKRSEHDPYRRPEVSNSVLETWNISMEYLLEENKTAYGILTVLAYVDSQNIPFEMITAIVRAKTDGDSDSKTSEENNEKRNSTNSVISSSSDSDGDDIEDDVVEAVSRLEEFSFLTMRAMEIGGSNRFERAYDMHKLVQEAVSYNLHLRKGGHSEEVLSARTAFQVVDSLFPEEWSSEKWSGCEKYLGHVQRTGEWAQSHDGEEKVARLLSRTSDYLYARGRWTAREMVDIVALKLRKRALGDEHNDTVWSQARLAVTYNGQGRYKEAVNIMERVLQKRQDILGREHIDTIWSMATLAVIYHTQGKYNVAEKMYKEVLGLRREILGEKHPDTIKSMADLATTYSTQGKYNVAEKMRVEALELRREILGEKHLDTIWSMADLATTYYTQGKYDVTKRMYKEVLGLRREILGEKHPDTIRSMAYLATAYSKQGKYDEAEKIYIKVLELRREILGEKHPDTIWSIADLATTYSTQGKYNVAEKMRVEVLELRREILGEKHLDTIWSMADLATTYYTQRKYDVAEKMDKEVLRLRREILGEKHPDTIRSIADLATTYSTQGKYDVVEKMRVEVLELRREILGEKHPDTIESVSDLERTRRALEVTTDAENDILSVAGLSFK